MKKIKINTTVNLKSGVSLASGSIVVIAEGYADVKNELDGSIPAQISTLLYASEDALASGKSNITDVLDFEPTFSSLSLSVEDYKTKTAESLLVDAVYSALSEIYADNIEIV